MITGYTSPSEITYNNRHTEHVFNRFGINPYNTDKIYKNTALIEVNPDFLVEVLNIFCQYKDVENCLFEKYPIPVLVDYLKRSHKYYEEKILPEIGQSISNLLNNYHKKHPLLEILYRFYFKYKVDILEHFSNEEELLFPYAIKLYRTVHFKNEIYLFMNFLKNYSLKNFIETHSDVGKELINIRKVLLEYDPPITNKTTYRVLIEQLKNFEKDLHIHAFIEDEVLVPKIYQLEQNVKLEINN